MPVGAVAVNHIVFLDPSDPRIPYYSNSTDGSFLDGAAPGWTKSNVVVITKEDTAAAKAAGCMGLKPYGNDPDSTNTFFEMYRVPPVASNHLTGLYGESNGRVKRELEKADNLRILYPNWVAEEQRNPLWYNEIPETGILVLAKGKHLDNSVAESMAQVRDRPLSDGRSLAALAEAYYNIQLQARKAWWAKYDELLNSSGFDVARNEADTAQAAVLNQFKEAGKRRQGGKRRRRVTRRR
jgi:hypothetical protein